MSGGFADRVSGGFADRVRRVWPALAGWRRDGAGEGSAGRLVVALPGAVPGWLVRLAPPLLVLVVGATGAGGVPAWPVLAGLAALATWRPGGLVPAGLVALLAVQLMQAGDPGLVLLAALVLGVHLVAASAGLARHVAWRALVDPAALGRLALDLLPVQVVSQVLVLVVGLVARGGAVPAGSPASLALRAVAVVALIGALLAVSSRRGR